MRLIHTSYGLYVDDYSMSIYYVACFHVADKSFPVSCIHCILILFKSYCKGDDPCKRKTDVLLQFDHFVSSIQFATKNHSRIKT